MPRKEYTPATHQSAFEMWVETRNLSHVARTVGCEYTTIRGWAEGNYKCRYHCPWHGWTRLLAEKEDAFKVRNELLEQGIVDPLVHEQALAEAIPRDVTEEKPDVYVRRKAAIDAIVRSDIERISHFELLYGKVFQEATGVSVNPMALLGMSEEHAQRLALQALKDDGRTLKTSSMEAAIKSLITISEYINKLKAELGVNTTRTSKSVSVTVDLDAEEPAPKELSIDELRKYRELLSNTPADKIEDLKSIVLKEEKQVELLLEDVSAKKEAILPFLVPVSVEEREKAILGQTTSPKVEPLKVFEPPIVEPMQAPLPPPISEPINYPPPPAAIE